MNATTPHCYATVAPHPLTVPSDVQSGKYPLIDPEALAVMRARSKDWPTARWSAHQNVNLSSADVGHLKFVAVGPDGRGISCLDRVFALHWSYAFVGWVNLESGTIVPEAP